jgi:Asp/Glu/hydantoin racemase
VTFAPSARSLASELTAMAAELGRQIEITAVIADGALAALKAGDGALHDQLAANAASALSHCDVVILGQFSLARAAMLVAERGGRPVITPPDAAVEELRAILSRGTAPTAGAL